MGESRAQPSGNTTGENMTEKVGTEYREEWEVRRSFSKISSYYPKAQAGGAAQMQSHRLHHKFLACEL